MTAQISTRRIAAASLFGWLIGAATLLAAGSLPDLAQPAPGTRPAQAAAGQGIRVDIPAQPLPQALAALSAATGLHVLYTGDRPFGVTSRAVSGSMTAEQALQRLLAGTGLSYSFTNANTVTLVPAPPAPSSDAGPTTLPEIDVTAGQQRGWSPARGYLPEVSATGTRTDTPPLETPQSIVTVTREQMQAQAVQEVGAALRYAPGVAAEPFGVSDPRSDWVRARGFELPQYLDGLRLPSLTYAPQPRTELWGLERIEVLLGPASALYGQVPPGGMMNMISRRPPAEPTHEIQLQTGSYGRLQGSFDLGGPIDPEGRFLYRFTGLVRDADTQTDELRDRRLFLAPSITWRPTADTSLTLLANILRDRNGMAQFLPAQGTLLGNPFGRIPSNRFLGEPDFNRANRTQYGIGYAFEHRFNDTWTVRQNLRYSAVDLAIDTVYALGLAEDLRSVNRAAVGIREQGRSFGVDNQVQADFATGPLRHRVLFGLDYQRITDDLRFSMGSAPSIDAFAPVYGQPFSRSLALLRSTVQDQNQFGVYLQDQIRLDRWVLTLSGRHDWVDTETRDRVGGTRVNQNDTAFSGRVGLNYVFDFGLAPYVSYARSFQPVTGTTAGGTPFRPSEGEQYEIGIKYQPPGTRSFASLALYQTTQRNVLTPDSQNPNFNVQTGEARVRGVELAATASLDRGLNLTASYTYADSEVTRSNGADLGKQLAQVPRHQASLWLDQGFSEGLLAGLGLGAGVRVVGAAYGDAANSFRASSATLVDAAIRYDLGQIGQPLQGMQLALNVSNLFDKDYVASCTSIASCYYGNRRLVLVSLGYRW
ncbi:TonB-dependent siderophore receptor [Roseomonas hellenica]|uniref:TonB-dependent siderophore receptor n=1 Tax=Plastoroseomonas hellenica TaxID=2687306 RepID=A0ABS5EY78_9PROT|nr:TonB-dependent siderophore receptor [Plastoroseomonas hellenica]MBR0665236.1 TonB-dependent siderophore receptor [Plastoroseomonas hellenica]